jgi:hypothetical protein
MSKRRNYKREHRELKELIRWKVEVNDLYRQKGTGYLIRRKFDPYDELKNELKCITDHIEVLLNYD